MRKMVLVRLDLCDRFGCLYVVNVWFIFTDHAGLNVATLSPDADWRNIHSNSQ